MAGGLARTLLCVLIQRRGRVSGAKGSVGGGGEQGARWRCGGHMPGGRDGSVQLMKGPQRVHFTQAEERGTTVSVGRVNSPEHQDHTDTRRTMHRTDTLR
uniref:Secreted protein n=1 Tax=Knipowitschia caucasica TaxID=637954 RepID=A0AAV2KWW8_KNICA